MLQRQRLSTVAIMIFVVLVGLPVMAQTRQTPPPKTPPANQPAVPAQTAPVVPAKPIKRDEVFFAIERIVSSKNNDAGVSGITAELDGVIEITNRDITTNPFFFRKEAFYLRAQIARICHST